MNPPRPNLPDDQDDPFYVGYLDTPDRYRRSIKLVIVLITVWSAMTAFLVVLAQRPPGNATWDISNERTWSGLLLEEPYPMLVTERETLLVVRMGKRGAHDLLKDLYGSEYTINGYALQRDGRKMIELAPDFVATPTQQQTIRAPELMMLSDEPMHYTGEIIDGKCFLGAMKPGNGFGHRSCAVLCLQGGLPPMFADRNASPDAMYPLLLIDGSTTLPDHVLSKVARHVRISATPAMLGDLPVLVTSAAEIEVINNLFAPSASSAKP
jgi:hypothetical protein